LRYILGDKKFEEGLIAAKASWSSEAD
jgi:hypothetical protein